MHDTNRKVQYLAGICVSFAFTFTGATISWPSPAIPKFKNGEANLQITDAQSSWVVSLAALGALPGCYLGQVLSERAGRKRTVFAATVPGFIGAGIILVSKTPEIMYFARILMGISNGITAVVTMIYLTEIADKEIRGSLGMLVQVMNNLGSLAMYSIGPFVSYLAINSIVLALPIVCLLICLWIPESPYYHLKEGRLARAKKEFRIIKGSNDEKWVDDQLLVIRAHVRESMENKTTLKELFTNRKYRKAVYIVAGYEVAYGFALHLMVSSYCSPFYHRCGATPEDIDRTLRVLRLKVLQYMTGSLAIQSYLEIIFRQSSSISGAYASIVYGFIQLGAGIAATFLAGCFGRRILMFISCFGVGVSLTVVGLYFFLQDFVRIGADTLASIAVMPLIGVLSFNILYAFGIGNLPYIMQAELFPINVKTVASSTATMMACIMNFGVIKSYQGIKDVFGHYTVFWSFASVAYFGMAFIYFFVPETKDKTLEEVQDTVQVEAMDIEKVNIKTEELEDD